MYCVNVAINLPIKNLFRQYTYSVPEDMAHLDVGWRCLVDFAGREVEGFVVARVPQPENLSKLKSVTRVIGSEPWFDAEMIATARWLSDYYMCSLAEAMRLFIPGKTSIKMTEKTVYAYGITALGRELLQAGTGRAKLQLKALGILDNAGEPLTGAELLEQGISQAVLRVLAEKGNLKTHNKDKYALKKINWSRIIDDNITTLPLHSTLGEYTQYIAKSRRNLFVVLDENNKFAGLLVMDDHRDKIFDTSLYDKVLVDELMIEPEEFIYDTDTGEELLEKFNRTQNFNMPVITHDRDYIGFLSKAKVLNDYRDFIAADSED